MAENDALAITSLIFNRFDDFNNVFGGFGGRLIYDTLNTTGTELM